jgi:hypothetical protein
VRGAAQVVASGKKKEIMMWEALREALDEEMERDPTVCLMGRSIERQCICSCKLPQQGRD